MLFAKLQLSFSPPRERNSEHIFQRSFEPDCDNGSEIESTSHFSPHSTTYDTLMNTLKDLDFKLLEYTGVNLI